MFLSMSPEAHFQGFVGETPTSWMPGLSQVFLGSECLSSGSLDIVRVFFFLTSSVLEISVWNIFANTYYCLTVKL